MAPRALVSIGVDADCVSGWLGSYNGEDSPNDISRGMFAGQVGTIRMLKMFKKYGIRTSWFIPGHTLDTFPEEMAKVRDEGHEIGLHGYSHENPTAMSFQQQSDVLDKTVQQLTDFCGKPPRGNTAAWWESSREGFELLKAKGIEYDHSSQAQDCQPFYTRDADTWTKINYDGPAKDWFKPLVRGSIIDLVTIPANWVNNSHGFVDADVTLKLWKAHFDYFYRENEFFVFPLTLHPDVSGRPHLILILEKLIEYINTHEGVEWVTMGEVNDEFRKRNPIPVEPNCETLEGKNN